METKLSIRWELNIAVLGTDPHTMGIKYRRPSYGLIMKKEILQVVFILILLFAFPSLMDFLQDKEIDYVANLAQTIGFVVTVFACRKLHHWVQQRNKNKEK